MSKKIAKRSLALGALMAFVITGSAMATATDMKLDQITDDLTITGQDLVVTTNGTSVYNKDVKVISDSDITINGSDEGILAHGTVTIDAKNVNIEAGDNGVKASIDTEDSNDLLNYSKVTITAKEDVNIESKVVATDNVQHGGEGYAITNVGGEVDITAGGNVTLSSVIKPAIRVLPEDGAQNVKVNVSGKNITINGYGGYVSEEDPKEDAENRQEYKDAAIYAENKGILNLTATDTIKITDIAESGGNAVGAYDGGVVNIKDANNIVIDGKLYASGIGSKIIVDADKANIIGNIHVENGGGAENNGIVSVTGANITFETTGEGDQAEIDTVLVHGGQVNLNASGNLSLTSVKGHAVNAKSGTVNLSASKANIKGAMYVGNGANLNLTGIKELTLTGLVNNNTIPAIQVEGGTLKVNTNGTLAIDGATEGVYKVIAGFSGEEKELWSDDNLVYDRTAWYADGTLDENGNFNVEYEVFDASDASEEEKDVIKNEMVVANGGSELAVPNLVGSTAGQKTNMDKHAPGASKFFSDVSKAPEQEMPKETKAAVINSAAQLAEAGGNSSTAVNVAGNVSGATTGRLSFNGGGHGGGHKGGHGVGLFEEGSGAAIWAQYLHGKDKGEDVPMEGGVSNYESNYDGIVLGVDFKKVGKYQSGMAFNYGEGDSNGFTSAATTKSDFDFWGIGYYGNIRNEDTNFIFDVNYAQSESDVTQHNLGSKDPIEASPETTTWTVGVKAEKLYQNNNVQIVPYAGLRYMSVDTDEYTSNIDGKKLFNYAPERQDIWLLPLGVSLKQEVVNDNGWTVTPKVDLSYIWAFGDTDSNMELTIPGVEGSTDNLGFTVMDDGSLLGLVGIEASKGDWTFGVSYSYQKGDYTESEKWYVDAKYSF